MVTLWSENAYFGKKWAYCREAVMESTLQEVQEIGFIIIRIAVTFLVYPRNLSIYLSIQVWVPIANTFIQKLAKLG
jgi:hypothetical protein